MPEIPHRRGTSAAHYLESKTFEESPDPLEPWSIRGITDLNTILADDHDEHDSF